MTRWILAAAGCLLLSGLAAQDEPTARVFCDAVDPGNGCPGVDCKCVEDVLAIRFERSGGPILEIEDEPGLPIEAVVALERKSAGLQGWSYGVRHDHRALTIESVTTDGTDASHVFRHGLNVTRFQPEVGFISAIVLGLGPGELSLEANSLARAIYRLERGAAEVGDTGVLLEFTDGLAIRSSRLTPISLTVDGRSMQPGTVVDGKILVGKPFHRGDPDGDGRISIADAIALLLFLFLAGPSPGCLEAGDVDDDGRIDTTDPVVILRWLFGGGSAPAPPGPPPAPCGRDPETSSASLGCDAYGGC